MTEGVSSAPRPVISVIVPVRDDADGCRVVLARLASQTLPSDQFEVIIGDDGSSPNALEGLATADGRVRIVAGPPDTSYAARNRAAANSRADVLAFCDSDCQPDPAWLRAGLAALDHADVVAGEVTLVSPSRPNVWTILTFDNFLDQARNARRGRGVTANLLVRRADFERWGRFDRSLVSGGDFDFVGRAVARGARLTYARDAIVRHPTLDDARSFLRKVWRTNRWSAIRRRRSGQRLTAATIVGGLPIAGGIFVRRATLRNIASVDRTRLQTSGIQATRSTEIAALVVYYLVVSPVANLARLVGWLSASPAPPSRAVDGPAPRSGSSASAR